MIVQFPKIIFFAALGYIPDAGSARVLKNNAGQGMTLKI
jgi:hypothetical protein